MASNLISWSYHSHCLMAASRSGNSRDRDRSGQSYPSQSSSDFEYQRQRSEVSDKNGVFTLERKPPAGNKSDYRSPSHRSTLHDASPRSLDAQPTLFAQENSSEESHPRSQDHPPQHVPSQVPVSPLQLEEWKKARLKFEDIDLSPHLIARYQASPIYVPV